MKCKHVRTHYVQEVLSTVPLYRSTVCAKVSGIVVKLGDFLFHKIDYGAKCIRDNCVENTFYNEFWKGVLSSGGHISVEEFINCSCCSLDTLAENFSMITHRKQIISWKWEHLSKNFQIVDIAV